MNHPLTGCRAKIERAEESCGILSAEVDAHLQSDEALFQTSTRHQADGLEFAFIASGNPDPPPRFSVIAGEIIHNLRSSLDHVINVLVVNRGKTPTRHHQFPICSTSKSFKDLCGRGYIQGVGPSARKIIEDVQPFHSEIPNDTVLAAVHDLNNIDKHRLLVVTTTALQIGNEIRIGTDNSIDRNPDRMGKNPTIVGLGDPSAKKLSLDGVVVFTIRLAEPAPELTATAEIRAEIAFQKCGQAELVPLVKTLGLLIRGVRHTVERFSNEFQ